jgi:hypothetical protein
MAHENWSNGNRSSRSRDRYQLFKDCDPDTDPDSDPDGFWFRLFSEQVPSWIQLQHYLYILGKNIESRRSQKPLRIYFFAVFAVQIFLVFNAILILLRSKTSLQKAKKPLIKNLTVLFLEILHKRYEGLNCFQGYGVVNAGADAADRSVPFEPDKSRFFCL